VNVREAKWATIKTAVIDENTAANIVIVAAVPGRRLVITYLVLQPETNTNTIVLLSNTTALTAPLSLATTNAFNVFGDGNEPILVTAVGEAFEITLSAAEQVNGWVTYYELE